MRGEMANSFDGYSGKDRKMNICGRVRFHPELKPQPACCRARLQSDDLKAPQERFASIAEYLREATE